MGHIQKFTWTLSLLMSTKFPVLPEEKVYEDIDTTGTYLDEDLVSLSSLQFSFVPSAPGLFLECFVFVAPCFQFQVGELHAPFQKWDFALLVLGAISLLKHFSSFLGKHEMTGQLGLEVHHLLCPVATTHHLPLCREILCLWSWCPWFLVQGSFCLRWSTMSSCLAILWSILGPMMFTSWQLSAVFSSMSSANIWALGFWQFSRWLIAT